MLIRFCDFYASLTDVLIIRDPAMILLSFVAFVRYDELMKRCDVKIFDDYLSIFINKGKTDQ